VLSIILASLNSFLSMGSSLQVGPFFYLHLQTPANKTGAQEKRMIVQKDFLSKLGVLGLNSYAKYLISLASEIYEKYI
jgi:hypothetical protein